MAKIMELIFDSVIEMYRNRYFSIMGVGESEVTDNET